MTASRDQSRGQELVEFAITLPVLFLILMAILDMGRATYYYSVVHNLAREGARYGVVYPDDLEGIDETVRARAIGIEADALTVEIDLPDEYTVQVTVTYPFVPATPMAGLFFDSIPVTLGSRASMGIER